MRAASRNRQRIMLTTPARHCECRRGQACSSLLAELAAGVGATLYLPQLIVLLEG